MPYTHFMEEVVGYRYITIRWTESFIMGVLGLCLGVVFLIPLLIKVFTGVSEISDIGICLLSFVLLVVGALLIRSSSRLERTSGIIVIVDSNLLVLPRDKKEIPFGDIDFFSTYSNQSSLSAIGILPENGIIKIHFKNGDCVEVGDTVKDPKLVVDELNRRLGKTE